MLAINLLHGRYRAFTSLSSVDYSGNRIVNAPGLSLNGRLGYALPVAGGSLAGELLGSYQTTMFLNPENSDTYKVRPYALVNARLAYRPARSGLEIAGFVRNQTNKRAITYVAPIITQYEVNYTDPRTYGLQVTWHFGARAGS